MSIKPPIEKMQYNQQLPGFYGQFGSGAGIHAFYLQSVLSPNQLDRVSLITEIRGSESWPVSDLFQRDIDNDRITHSLLPYLQDVEKIKFFNPLTLTLLPMKDDSTLMLPYMPKAVESSIQKDGMEWKAIERPNYHRIRWIRDNPQYAVLEWNDIRTKLVAIDGQHRLSALKRFRNDCDVEIHQDFMTWGIPVVVVSFRVGTEESSPPSVLDVVRNIFVYINTEAQKINRTRQILLSDESVNAVCTQELVQLAHANDLEPPAKRIHSRLPLLFYDWRGEEENKRRVHAPAAVKNIEEIHDWFEYYILGTDFSNKQKNALRINPTHELNSAFHHEVLNHADSKKLRKLVGDKVLPAVSYLLENFSPYKSYIVALRDFEQKCYKSDVKSDLIHYAFHELRFGPNLAPDPVKLNVEHLLLKFKEEIAELKRNWLTSPIDLDIGMRGVVCAFGELRSIFGRLVWMSYAKWFVEALNRLYDDGRIDLRCRATRRLLLHVVEDHNETIVNYRLEDAEHALGAYLQLFVVAYGWPLPEKWKNDWAPWKDVLLETLKYRIMRGYRRQIRARLRQEEEFRDGGKPLTDEVRRQAEREASRHIRRLERELNRIENGNAR